MNGLNISLINRREDALRYIVPVTDAEKVLYDMLMDADYDLNKWENDCGDYQEIKDERDDLKIDLSNAEDEMRALRADIARLEREQ